MKIKITFLEDMLATCPKNEEVLTKYIGEKATKENLMEEVETLSNQEKFENLDEKGTTVFMRDENGELFIWNYMCKGFLKNAGDVIRRSKPEKSLGAKGTKWGAIKGKVDDFIKIYPRKIKLGCKKEDGICERSLRAMTAQGARVGLARSQYINAGKSIEFEIKIYPGAPITEEMIAEMLNYGEWVGIGQWRNADHGSFKWEKLD